MESKQKEFSEIKKVMSLLALEENSIKEQILKHSEGKDK